ncbi:MAG: hypothetical protein ACI81A_002863 [Paraglaciecola sp.]|jgi:hypothetical protein
MIEKPLARLGNIKLAAQLLTLVAIAFVSAFMERRERAKVAKHAAKSGAAMFL